MKRTRWYFCNVLRLDADSRQLWAFAAGKKGFTLNHEQAVPAALPLPAKTVARDWTTLLRPKLNVALLPIESVFLRVIQLPISAFDETVAMVELQLEKISPLPVAQVVWSIQVLPQQVDNLQTVVVIIVARDVVDQFMGQLEGQGFLADRLEAPLLDQLQATPITGDGAWIYPGETADKFTALVAWWYGGVLRSLGLLHVPAVQNRGELLEEQLKQMTWAGELEGWLTSPPHWHLVATEAVARIWQPLFFSWLGNAVDVEEPLAPADLATLTPNRAARTEAKATLLPADYSNRYHQEFVDGLWIKSLAAVLGVYLLAVLVYFAGMEYQTVRTDRVEAQVKSLGVTYTNTLQLKARLEILQTRESLKFASLKCWQITAELLPESLTLQSMDFKGGRTLSLQGTAPASDRARINDFNVALRKAKNADGQPVFKSVEEPVNSLVGNQVSWNFSGELAQGEGP